ncbi:hypothetical protein SELMODRAFT_138433 [Selaginella moellendorffii]|uniref:NADH:quinone oxidoreductase/Mrp antiporter transmembrane domain-containing protein n=1 Tax=Selaginella moellendorffii TaxID=88036 RepID=D8TFC2_SELML|nr:hypothetical protein SELMODRAFT_138433 [Selaginella moellendorffii]
MPPQGYRTRRPLLATVLVGVGIPITINSIHDTLLTDSSTHCRDTSPLVGTAGTIMPTADHGGRDTSRASETIAPIPPPTPGMPVLISASDSPIMPTAMEPQTPRSHAPAAPKRDPECPTEAGPKYPLPGAPSPGPSSPGKAHQPRPWGLWANPIRPTVHGSTGVTNSEESGIPALTRSWGVPDPSTGIPIIGIPRIVVGSPFKITAVPPRSERLPAPILYMRAPDVYEGPPTLATAFPPTAPKIAIPANMVRVPNHRSHDASLRPAADRGIGPMIPGTVAAMAQQKAKRPAAHSPIGHVGHPRIGFAGGTTMEGIQPPPIGPSTHLSMTVNAPGPPRAVRPVRSQYLGDPGAFGKPHPPSAITPSPTTSPYAGIPPLAGSRSKSHPPPGAIRCGADVPAGLGVVTSAISRSHHPRPVKPMYSDLPGEHMIPPRLDRDNPIVPAITVARTTPMPPHTPPLFPVTHYMAMGPSAESGVGFSGSVA